MRHRCFVSHHHDDIEVAQDLIARFGGVFIPTALGVTSRADFVASEDEDYIKRRIRELYLASTTVTIVIVGQMHVGAAIHRLGDSGVAA